MHLDQKILDRANEDGQLLLVKDSDAFGKNFAKQRTLHSPWFYSLRLSLLGCILAIFDQETVEKLQHFAVSRDFCNKYVDIRDSAQTIVLQLQEATHIRRKRQRRRVKLFSASKDMRLLFMVRSSSKKKAEDRICRIFLIRKMLEAEAVKR